MIMETMKMGILGSGGIAHTMANTVKEMKDVELYAVGSRTLENAEKFAAEFGISKAYGSYEELAADPEVDLVYVATPHSHHYPHVKLLLEHGKHVLCEKAFTVNANQARELFQMAEEKNLLLTEAIWTRYIPIQKTLNEVVNSGVIGKVYSLTANLCYLISGVERLKKPELAGGALLDVGVYPLNFACMIDQTPVVKISSDATMNEYGVDSSNSITLTFEDGATAILHSSMMVLSDRRGMIYGDRGYIEVENINNCQGFKVYDTNYQLVKEYPVPPQISGYEYEVEACKKAIEEGRSECPEMPHKESIRMLEIMDTIRKEWGLKYPME